MSADREFSAIDAHVRGELVRFVRGLRRRGVAVPANAGIVGMRAIAAVGLSDRDRLRTALRAALLTDSADFDTFDHLFETFWDRLTAPDRDGPAGGDDAGDGAIPSPVGAETPAIGPDGDDGGPATRTHGESFESSGDVPLEDGEGFETALYSPTGASESVGDAPFPVTPDLDGAFAALSDALRGLRGRRYRAGGERPDPRRMLRESVSTGGIPLSIPRRERRATAVRALLLVDVSRSVLDTIDRGFLLEFLRRAVEDWRDVRVFFFDENIREVTRAIDADSATAARQALSAAETAWGGGTQIGASLARLHEQDPAVADRRTITFVISDGLEMGDVDQLEDELSWISRRSRRLFWLNPLAAAQAYEPTARGMAAAMPYLDGLFAFASPADVTELARQLRRSGPGGRVGYQYEGRRGGRVSEKRPSVPRYDT